MVIGIALDGATLPSAFLPWLRQELGVIVLPPLADRVRPFELDLGPRPIFAVGLFLARLRFRFRASEFLMRFAKGRKPTKAGPKNELRKFCPSRAIWVLGLTKDQPFGPFAGLMMKAGRTQRVFP